MKIQLNIEIEIPEENPIIEGFERESIEDLLFDHYVNYVTKKHFEDAMKWALKSQVGSTEENIGAKKIYLNHKTWGEIASKANWDFMVTY